MRAVILLLLCDRGTTGPGPLCGLEDKTAVLKETPQTGYKTGQRRRESGGGPWRAHVSEVHVKHTWWHGGRRPVAGRQARPRASFPYAGQPAACLEGPLLSRALPGRAGPPGLWEVGCVPLAARARFPSESITPPAPDVRSVCRPGTSGTCA